MSLLCLILKLPIYVEITQTNSTDKIVCPYIHSDVSSLIAFRSYLGCPNLYESVFCLLYLCNYFPTNGTKLLFKYKQY